MQDCNSFGYVEPHRAEPQTMAFVLNPVASMFNHSCYPNVAFTFKPVEEHEHDKNPHWRGPAMWFYALEDIAAGEELCDHYGAHDHGPAASRRRRLQSQYGFWCTCARYFCAACKCFAMNILM